MEAGQRSAVHPEVGQRPGGVLPLPGVPRRFALGVETTPHAGAGGHAGRPAFDLRRAREGVTVGRQGGGIGTGEEQAVLGLVARARVAEEAVVARLALTLAGRGGDAAAGRVGEGPGGRRRSVAEDREGTGGLGAAGGGRGVVLAAVLGRPQAGLQSALPALERLHQLLQLSLGAGAPEHRPAGGAAGLDLHTVCGERSSRLETPPLYALITQCKPLRDTRSL